MVAFWRQPKGGRPLSVPDDATAANGCALATCNMQDFATAGLEIVNLSQASA